MGEEVGGLIVRHLDELKECVAEEASASGSSPPHRLSAQEVAERFVDAGIKSILNFAPAVVNVPPDVNVSKVDLSIELQILSFYQQRTQAIAAAREANRRLNLVRARPESDARHRSWPQPQDRPSRPARPFGDRRGHPPKALHQLSTYEGVSRERCCPPATASRFTRRYRGSTAAPKTCAISWVSSAI